MAVEKSSALVLRSTPFGDTSCVLTLYCRELGKVRGLAKGAWRPKSRFDGALDLLSACEVLVLRKTSGGLDLVTEASLESRFRVGTSLAAVHAALHVAELLDALTAEADPHAELFDVAHATLRDLSDWRAPDVGLPLLLLWVDLAILRLVGHAPETHCCAECRGPLPPHGRTAFGMLEGGTLCDRCRHGRRAVVSLSAPALGLLRRLAAPGIDRQEDPAAAAVGEVRGTMNTYLAHLLGRPLRVVTRPLGGRRSAARPT